MDTCRVCGASSLKSTAVLETHCLEKCRQCGFTQLAVKPDAQTIKTIYNDGYFQHGKYFSKSTLSRENTRRLSFLTASGLPPRSRVLDFGFGAGDFLSAASPQYDLWGVDLSESAAREARQRNPQLRDRIMVGEPEEQTFPNEFFDAIVAWDVVEHLWDPATACRALVRVLKPGGFFFLSTPNSGAPFARLTGRSWPFLTVPEHQVFFDRKSLRLFLEKRLGLEVQAWQTKGKWVNLGFLFYKLKRKCPRLVPERLIGFLKRPGWDQLGLYVPTGDVQYAVARKTVNGGRS